jgi:hypothetical protein
VGEREGDFRDNFNTEMKIKLKCSKENVKVGFLIGVHPTEWPLTTRKGGWCICGCKVIPTI